MNYLINPSILENAKEIIIKLTPEEKAITYALIDKELDAIKMEIRKQLFNGNLKDIEFTLNGKDKVLKLSKGAITVVETVSKVVDHEKAINYAKMNNLFIPMTERQVIEPTIDLIKLEQEVWFKEKEKDFINSVINRREVKSNDVIRISDRK